MNAKKVVLIIVGVLVAILVVIAVAGYMIFGAVFGFIGDKAGQEPQEIAENIPAGQTDQDSQQASGGSSSQTGEIVGETEKAGVPVPEFSVMEEVISEEKEGDSFKVMYGINKPEEGAVKDFYENNLGEDWSLEGQQTVSGQVMYNFTKGDDYELEVVVMSADEAPRAAEVEGNTALALEYSAPYQEDPYPDAINVAPTSDNAKKYNNDLMSVFEDIFGGAKLEDTGASGDNISLDYVVKKPITQDNATQVRTQLEDMDYNTKDVSKSKDKANYTFEKTYGDWSEVDMEMHIGEFIGNVQEIEVNVWP